MGVLGSIMTTVANLINGFMSKLPNFSVDSSQLGTSVTYLNNCISMANNIFPMDTVGQILSILCAFALAMLAFYVIQRVINLIRGAG